MGLMALVFSTWSPAYYWKFCHNMTQITLNTIQIVHTPKYEKLLIQIVNMGHVCENDMIQIKDIFQIVATWLQFSNEEYWCVTTPRVNKKKSSIGFFLEKILLH